MADQQASSLELSLTCREVGLEAAHHLWSLLKVFENSG